jgi:hypothetical protein
MAGILMRSDERTTFAGKPVAGRHRNHYPFSDYGLDQRAPDLQGWVAWNLQFQAESLSPPRRTEDQFPAPSRPRPVQFSACDLHSQAFIAGRSGIVPGDGNPPGTRRARQPPKQGGLWEVIASGPPAGRSCRRGYVGCDARRR